MKPTCRLFMAIFIAVVFLSTSCQPTDYSSDINSLKASRDSLAAALKITNANLQTTNNTMTNLSTSITSIQAQLAVISGQITTLNTTLAATNTTVAAHTTTIATIQSQIKTIQDQIAVLNAQQTSNSAALSALSADLTSIKTQLTSLLTQVATLNSQQIVTSTALNDIYAKLALSNSQLNSLTLQLNALLIATPTWLTSQTSWLNNSAANTITSPSSLLDNNSTTKGGLAMSNYSTVYTKEMFLDFGSPKTISGFSFAFEFPNVLTGKCSTFPGPGDIAHSCLGNLYFKNSIGQWISAYTCPQLNVSRADQGCPMTDTYSITFSGIAAKEWKFEMIGSYWLGGGYQTTTYYQISGIQFFGY